MIYTDAEIFEAQAPVYWKRGIFFLENYWIEDFSLWNERKLFLQLKTSELFSVLYYIIRLSTFFGEIIKDTNFMIDLKSSNKRIFYGLLALCRLIYKK